MTDSNLISNIDPSYSNGTGESLIYNCSCLSGSKRSSFIKSYPKAIAIEASRDKCAEEDWAISRTHIKAELFKG